jgi:hypothetical protein
MDRTAFIEWLKLQKYSGKIFTSRPEALARVHASLDRLEAYLAANWDGVAPRAMSLAALESYPFDLKADDDGILGALCAYLQRPDLSAYMGQVSARKFFMNKTLLVVFKDMPELLPAVKALAKLKIRMASELQTQGATQAGRAEIAQRSGLTNDTLLLLVKCCDLCRMTGMAGQALRRSLAMGYDTLAKFRAATPKELLAVVTAYFERTGDRTNAMIDYTWFIQQANDLEDQISM